VWLIVLSDQLPVVALVSRYLTNKLIGRESIPKYKSISSCLLPTLSLLSVGTGPENRLRYWCSSRYLRIPPLHREFRSPLPDPSHNSIDCNPGVEPRAFTADLMSRLRALYAQ